mmetsp:Transcript_81700/g.249558  ORF Transcript_81700/g.249558 Transcript_81700/m.249558 type:complete len:241 (-) Transcript_81700:227-949(-)
MALQLRSMHNSLYCPSHSSSVPSKPYRVAKGLSSSIYRKPSSSLSKIENTAAFSVARWRPMRSMPSNVSAAEGFCSGSQNSRAAALDSASPASGHSSARTPSGTRSAASRMSRACLESSSDTAASPSTVSSSSASSNTFSMSIAISASIILSSRTSNGLGTRNRSSSGVFAISFMVPVIAYSSSGMSSRDLQLIAWRGQSATTLSRTTLGSANCDLTYAFASRQGSSCTANVELAVSTHR